MKHIAYTAALAVLAALGLGTAVHANTHERTAATQGQSSLADGEVRKVDKEAKKITIKHGPLPNLDMPGMTMVFQVKDPAMLDTVKEGDKIRFSADKIGGAYTVTQLQQAK
jgi:Cu/Ag efflux protein CusF